MNNSIFFKATAINQLRQFVRTFYDNCHNITRLPINNHILRVGNYFFANQSLLP